MKTIVRDLLFNFLLKLGVCVSRTSDSRLVIKFLNSLLPNQKFTLIRLGGNGDGGYWIPHNLSGIRYCFSPGVANSSSFETELAARGIQVFLADKTVDGPAEKNTSFTFIKNHLGSYTDLKNSLISFEDWYKSSIPEVDIDCDLLLQMDIEGAEYEIIHSIPQRLLKKFKVLVIEFHHLHQLMNCNQFHTIERAFQKILFDFDVVHIENNTVGGNFDVADKNFSRLLEITFIRKQQ